MEELTSKLVSRKVDGATHSSLGNDAQEKKHLQFLLFLLFLNALLYTTITSVITFESIMNVDEGNNIRVVNPQKGKCKQDPGPMQATALEW